jgi:hypothetical protein
MLKTTVYLWNEINRSNRHDGVSRTDWQCSGRICEICIGFQAIQLTVLVDYKIPEFLFFIDHIPRTVGVKPTGEHYGRWPPGMLDERCTATSMAVECNLLASWSTLSWHPSQATPLAASARPTRAA